LQVLPLQIVLLKLLDLRTLSQPSVTVQFLEYVLPVLLEVHSVERVKYLLPNKPLRTLQSQLLQESQSLETTTDLVSGTVGDSPAKAVKANADKIRATKIFIFPPEIINKKTMAS
jgi:hypothetical protein|tara:strand:+ start:252 stop:596 length:345 start_codon:yes stop_codon:yes gene_type:complete